MPYHEIMSVIHCLSHGIPDDFQILLMGSFIKKCICLIVSLFHCHYFLFISEFICPNLGFYEFLKKDYLDQIISWQFPSGCFGEKSGQKVEEDIDLASLLEGYHNQKVNFIPEVRKSDLGGDVMNMKLSESHNNMKIVKEDSVLRFGRQSVLTTDSAVKLLDTAQSAQIISQIRRNVNKAKEAVKMNQSISAPKDRVQLLDNPHQKSAVISKHTSNLGRNVDGLNGKRRTNGRHLLVEKEMKGEHLVSFTCSECNTSQQLIMVRLVCYLYTH